MFSEFVDDIKSETLYSDNAGAFQRDVERQVRNAMRQMHMRGFYRRDRKELLLDITPNSNGTYVWEAPSTCRKMLAAEYVVTGRFPTFVMPGSLVNQFPVSYYAMGSSYVFRGLSAVDDQIAVAYADSAPYLRYYEEGERPAVYDRATGTWSYLDGGSYVSTLGSDELDEAARALVYDWTLELYEDILAIGTKSGIQQGKDDGDRARRSWSKFLSGIEDMHENEGHDSGGAGAV